MTQFQTKGESDNQSVGTFVTNKWLVGVMLLLIMSMGGYIFHGYDKNGDAQASTIQSQNSRITTLEIDVAAQKATQTAQYTEIIRRLDRMETYLYGSPNAQRR